ncbi:hypothetical protein CAOG_07135 [Capsaspora owczarzaki ATCC 30864]|uniref:hypothetical protein n=1 Tax=Capsaspora owczarzaki (strain ATCC 30864) TaxID=595528 RepID=UPI0001FE3CB9|nr:hypothetical protein CAOG_07135 [Capsaspora owczarzaki ATCC 30864]|eukprot:XP_004343859.1 hypothetical protein CAOG_07135 [Capsaspora owczarzaki ATCC 30864]
MIYDCVIVGGGAGGLSSALMLGRARRNVLLLTAGLPRNAPAEQAHSLFTRDGTPPLELPYTTVHPVENARVVSLAHDKEAKMFYIEYQNESNANAGGFSIMMTAQVEEPKPLIRVTARGVILATGVRDVLPPIAGIEQFWGKSVIHCPYCHGFEHADKRFAYMGSIGPMAVMALQLLRGSWAQDVVWLQNGGTPALTAEQLARLKELNVTIYDKKVAEFRGDDAGNVQTVVFEDGTTLDRDCILIHPDNKPNTDSIELKDGFSYKIMHTDTMDIILKGQTDVPGLYLVGDLATPLHQLSTAAYLGGFMAGSLNMYLSTL